MSSQTQVGDDVLLLQGGGQKMDDSLDSGDCQ